MRIRDWSSDVCSSDLRCQRHSPAFPRFRGDPAVTEAYIIDTVRTPRGIGKMGKGALSQMHPEHLSATVLAALKERNPIDTADVDDVIWGVSAALGLQAGAIGRMADRKSLV